TRPLRPGGLRAYCRRGQSSRQDEISILDWPQADQRQSRAMVGEGQGACGVVVAGLVQMAQGAGSGSHRRSSLGPLRPNLPSPDYWMPRMKRGMTTERLSIDA